MEAFLAAYWPWFVLVYFVVAVVVGALVPQQGELEEARVAVVSTFWPAFAVVMVCAAPFLLVWWTSRALRGLFAEDEKKEVK